MLTTSNANPPSRWYLVLKRGCRGRQKHGTWDHDRFLNHTAQTEETTSCCRSCWNRHKECRMQAKMMPSTCDHMWNIQQSRDELWTELVCYSSFTGAQDKTSKSSCEPATKRPVKHVAVPCFKSLCTNNKSLQDYSLWSTRVKNHCQKLIILGLPGLAFNSCESLTDTTVLQFTVGHPLGMRHY